MNSELEILAENGELVLDTSATTGHRDTKISFYFYPEGNIKIPIERLKQDEQVITDIRKLKKSRQVFLTKTFSWEAQRHGEESTEILRISSPVPADKIHSMFYLKKR